MKNSDYPAMPLSGDAYQDFAAYNPDKNGSSYNPECQGLTKREQACIQLGVPETGDPDLDEIIMKSERKRIAMHSMQGLATTCTEDGTWTHTPQIAAKAAVEYADTLLEELSK